MMKRRQTSAFPGIPRLSLAPMALFRFRILNVFAESTFGGNPLCVFEDARGMDDATMQSLALQFNLSETTFILPSTKATARYRIFTTSYEMPFAGHPTLGTAHVVRDLLGAGNDLTLEANAGLIDVSARGNRWTLTAPHRGAPRVRRTGVGDAVIARLLGLEAGDLLASPVWVDTGVEQLMIPLRSIASVRRAAPDSAHLGDWPDNSQGTKMGYVFAFDEDDYQRVVCRFFFTKSGEGVAEDPGTGSACANLGGWLVANNATLPCEFALEQGDALHRPCRLSLRVEEDGLIRVGGQVIEIGSGTIEI